MARTFGFTFLSEATEAQYAETPLISFLSTDDEARCLRLAFLCSMSAVKAECFLVRLPRRFWLVFQCHMCAGRFWWPPLALPYTLRSTAETYESDMCMSTMRPLLSSTAVVLDV